MFLSEYINTQRIWAMTKRRKCKKEISCNAYAQGAPEICKKCMLVDNDGH